MTHFAMLKEMIIDPVRLAIFTMWFADWYAEALKEGRTSYEEAHKGLEIFLAHQFKGESLQDFSANIQWAIEHDFKFKQ